eukprot:TRINITY_DN6756_c0_g1_i2.p1 TRINITY_DN6756_c0_g1~~TRINITY_DN6756_c0_g1_i2.p1  ORF type:complete len:2127 (+),score=511.75 TRINITY_DN6756_c0_g1_i2:141-6521(+)
MSIHTGPMDIISGMTQDELDSMRAEFIKHPQGLRMKEFIDVIDRSRSRLVGGSLPSMPEATWIARLTALFRTIDYNGDQRVDWDEFTGFCIDAQLRRQQLRPHEAIPAYKCAGVRDVPDTVHKLAYLPNWGTEGRVVVMAKAAPFTFIDPRSLVTLSAVPAHLMGEGAPTACEYIPGLQYFVAASSDSKVRIFDAHPRSERDGGLGQKPPAVLNLDSTQLKMKWHPQTAKLFSSSRTGELNSYELGRLGQYDDCPAASTSAPSSPHSPGKITGSAMRRAGRPSHRTAVWRIHDKNQLTDFVFMPQGALRVITCSLDGAIYSMDLGKSWSYDSEDRYSTWLLSGARGQAPPPRRMECAKWELGRVENGVLSLSYSAQCQYVCSVGFEHTACCWAPNVANCRTELIDRSNPHKANFVGIHAVDGTPQVLTADNRGVIKIWDLRTFRCVQTMPIGWSPDESFDIPSHMRVSGMCYADSCGALFAAGWRKVLTHRMYGEVVPNHLRASSGVGQPQPTPGQRADIQDAGEDGAIAHVRYNATQRAFITTSGRDIRIWDVDQGCLTAVYRDVATSDVTALCLDEYGRRFYFGTQEGKLCCRVFQTGHEIYDVAPQGEHRAEVTMVDYWPQHRMLLSASLDGEVHLCSDRDRGSSCIRIHRHGDREVLAVCHSPNLQLIASADARFVHMSDVQDPRRSLHNIDTAPDGTCEVVGLAFVSQVAVIAISMSSGVVRLYSTRPMQRLLEPGRTDLSPCLLAQWSNLAPHTALRWRLRHRLHELHVRRRRQEELSAEAPSRQRSSIVGLDTTARTPGSVAQDMTFDVQRVVSFAELPTTPQKQQQQGVPRRSVASAAETPNIAAWAHRPAISCLQYDLQEHLLWTGDSYGLITAWALCSVLQHHRICVVNYPVRCKADGSPPSEVMLACDADVDMGCDNRAVAVVRSWRAHREDVCSVHLTGDGERIVSSGADRRVLLWTTAGQLLAELSPQRHYPQGYGIARADCTPGRSGSMQQKPQGSEGAPPEAGGGAKQRRKSSELPGLPALRRRSSPTRRRLSAVRTRASVAQNASPAAAEAPAPPTIVIPDQAQPTQCSPDSPKSPSSPQLASPQRLRRVFFSPKHGPSGHVQQQQPEVAQLLNVPDRANDALAKSGGDRRISAAPRLAQVVQRQIDQKRASRSGMEQVAAKSSGGFAAIVVATHKYELRRDGSAGRQLDGDMLPSELARDAARLQQGRGTNCTHDPPPPSPTPEMIETLTSADMEQLDPCRPAELADIDTHVTDPPALPPMAGPPVSEKLTIEQVVACLRSAEEQLQEFMLRREPRDTSGGRPPRSARTRAGNSGLFSPRGGSRAKAPTGDRKRRSQDLQGLLSPRGGSASSPSSPSPPAHAPRTDQVGALHTCSSTVGLTQQQLLQQMTTIAQLQRHLGIAPISPGQGPEAARRPPPPGSPGRPPSLQLVTPQKGPPLVGSPRRHGSPPLSPRPTPSRPRSPGSAAVIAIRRHLQGRREHDMAPDTAVNRWPVARPASGPAANTRQLSPKRPKVRPPRIANQEDSDSEGGGGCESPRSAAAVVAELFRRVGCDRSNSPGSSPRSGGEAERLGGGWWSEFTLRGGKPRVGSAAAAATTTSAGTPASPRKEAPVRYLFQAGTHASPPALSQPKGRLARGAPRSAPPGSGPRQSVPDPAFHIPPGMQRLLAAAAAAVGASCATAAVAKGLMPSGCGSPRGALRQPGGRPRSGDARTTRFDVPSLSPEPPSAAASTKSRQQASPRSSPASSPRGSPRALSRAAAGAGRSPPRSGSGRSRHPRPSPQASPPGRYVRGAFFGIGNWQAATAADFEPTLPAETFPAGSYAALLNVATRSRSAPAARRGPPRREGSEGSPSPQRSRAPPETRRTPHSSSEFHPPPPPGRLNFCIPTAPVEPAEKTAPASRRLPTPSFGPPLPPPQPPREPPSGSRRGSRRGTASPLSPRRPLKLDAAAVRPAASPESPGEHQQAEGTIWSSGPATVLAASPPAATAAKRLRRRFRVPPGRQVRRLPVAALTVGGQGVSGEGGGFEWTPTRAVAEAVSGEAASVESSPSRSLGVRLHQLRAPGSGLVVVEGFHELPTALQAKLETARGRARGTAATARRPRMAETVG